MSGLKENDGKAARRNLSYKISLVVGVFVCCICVIALFGRSSKEDAKEVNYFNHKRDPLKTQNFKSVANAALPDDIQQLLQKRRLTKEERIKLILSGSVNLISIHVGSTVMASFCRLRWEVHKADPAIVPMFRDLLQKSGHCQDHEFTVDLDEIIDRVRDYDEEMALKNKHLESYAPHAMPPAGFVFHESRCGSTLVANSLAAVNPEMNRVYSESQPAFAALTSCGEEFNKCSKSDAAKLFRNVVYMMGRTDDPEEKRLFFKIQSVGSKSISVMREAFPDTPWIYVYRDPVQVMMSHLPDGNTQRAVCLRSKQIPPRAIKRFVAEKDSNIRVKDLTLEEYCAAHLATLCQAAYKEYSNNPVTGKFVNYVDLPGGLLDTIFPHHFNINVGPDEEKRVNDVCKVYSKSRNVGKEWKEDSDKKDKNASPEIRSASAKWLEDIYLSMEKTNTV